MNNLLNNKVTLGATVVIVVAVALAWSFRSPANPLPIASSDHVTNWILLSPTGSYPDESALIDKLNAELKAGTTSAATYDILIGLGNVYALTGDGRNAYQEYLSAAKKNPRAGLAFDNLGALFTELGAFNTARTAYARAVALEPSVSLYQISYLKLLTDHFAKDPATSGAFANAKRYLSAGPEYLIAEATWFTNIGQNDKAIADWQAALPLVSSAQQAQIQAIIATLHGR